MASIEVPRAPARVTPGSLGRWALAGLGVACVGLGLAGIFVPGLPTTIFLIAASFLFARSCPWLEERLLRRRIFAPYWRYLEGEVEMPRRARIAATATMWTAVAASLTVAALTGNITPGFAIAVVAAALVGTVMIVRFRRAARRGVPPAPDARARD